MISMWIGECSFCCFLKYVVTSFVLLTLRERLFSCHHQGPHLLPVGCLVIVGNQVYYCCVICVATQSWVNKEYRRGLSPHPCGAPMLRISVVEVLFPTFTTWGQLVWKSRTQLYMVRFRPRASSLMMRLEGTIVWKAELWSMNSILT